MVDFFSLDGVDESVIKRERAKARELRKTRWWQQKTSSGLCYYCHKKFPYKQLTMDHLVPLARGGEAPKIILFRLVKIVITRKKI